MQIEQKRNVITIDVIRSKKEKYLGQIIREKIAVINPDRYAFSPALSRGDEIQCVVKRGENPFSAIREMRFALLDYQLKIGIGLGEIEIPEIVRDSWDLSGEAFFRAREALDQLSGADETCVKMCSGDIKLDLAINSALTLMNLIMNNWTPTQFNYIMFYERYGTYEKAAQALQVSSQNINKACKRAHWDVIGPIEDHLFQLIDQRE